VNHFADLPLTWRWAIALWLAALGGCVGSFLNVVVYRLPAGKSLVHPGSHCPKCGHAIRWYDNVPIFGWFLLRGRCRDCREPISFRYPLVEAITAGLCFGLAWVELLSGGANLPAREIALTPKQVIYPGYMTSEIVGIYAVHLSLLCTLVSASLIEHDGHRVPFRLFVPVISVQVLGLLFVPGLHPGRIDVWYSGPLYGLIGVLILSIAGLAVGRALGWFVPRYTSDTATASSSFAPCSNRQAGSAFGTFWRGRNAAADGILWATACVSLFFGGCVLLLGAAVLFLVLLNHALRWAFARLPFVGPVLWLTVLTLVFVIFWGSFVQQLAAVLRELTMR